MKQKLIEAIAEDCTKHPSGDWIRKSDLVQILNQHIGDEPTDEFIELFNHYSDAYYNPANAEKNYRARHFYRALIKQGEEG